MSTRSKIAIAATFAFVALALGSTGCGTAFTPVRESQIPLSDPGTVTIERAPLGYSNVFLLRRSGSSSSTGVVLVDAGAPSDIERTTAALAKVQLKASDVKAVVLTHGHGDHAGMGSFFQKAGAKIIVGRGDELQTTVGKNDEMTSQSLFARVLKPFVKLDYEPFTPDVFVDQAPLDLAPYGLPGVIVKHMPGHTRGSLVVFPSRREAIVGDMLLGGVWGGMFHEQTAGDHYYQTDPVQNKCNVHTLLEDEGIEIFHLGHGGPVTRDAVLAWQKSWKDSDYERCHQTPP